MSKQLMRKWISRSLPSSVLKQGSTLSIRSRRPNTMISIKPQWRDDGYLSMLQYKLENNSSHTLQVFKHDDQQTSIGRHESHISICLNDSDKEDQVSSSTSTLMVEEEDEVVSSYLGHENILVMGYDGSIVKDDLDFSSSASPEYKRVEYKDGVSIIESQEKKIDEETTKLSLVIPEKLNINCNLEAGGSIRIHGKIEGDVNLNTTKGNIQVKKLRGHNLNLEVLGPGGTIYASDLLEAETLEISIPPSNGSRFRAKRIHAGNCNIHVIDNNSETGSSENGESSSSTVTTFDVDDSGAVCDISSLYITNDANVTFVDSQTKSNNVVGQQPVRIKSHHGHLIVNAQAPKPNIKNEMTNEFLPIVDLGGVNGSCEVYVQQQDSGIGNGDQSSESESSFWPSCRVHFDSILPDSASVIKTDSVGTSGGGVQMTVDRKVESDIRLLSASNLSSLNVDDLLLDIENDGDEDNHDLDTFKTMLKNIDNDSSSTKTSAGLESSSRIQIGTKAFTEKEKNETSVFPEVGFADGWIENKSEEPDSRFDRKIRGNSGSSSGNESVGKIRLEGAEMQALRGFQKDGAIIDSSDTGGKNEFPRPIVAIASTGQISLETLSWLGNIARRYGLADKRDSDDLGRTATRRGRSFTNDPSDQ